MMDISINFVKPHVVRDIWREPYIENHDTFLQDLLSYKKRLEQFGISFWLDIVDVGVFEVLDPLALAALVLVPIPVLVPCSS